MAFKDNQNEYPVPSNNDRETARLLPRYFRTDANKKFLGSTLDQATNPGVVEKINGFVGRKEAKAATINDFYISDINKSREDYQLEPFTVIEDNIGNVTFNADYLDILGQLNAFGSNVQNHDNLFKQEFYAWDPHIDFDKFTNFREYYWLPNGPQEVAVRGQSKEVVSTFNVETVTDDNNTAFVFTPDGLTRNRNIKLYRGQTYRFIVNTPGHPFGIALSRAYQPAFVEDSSLITSMYTEGVTITHNEVDDTLNQIEDYIRPGFVENGVLEFTVPETAPDTLYYISQFDINTSGAFSIYDIEANSSIDVQDEIIGKKTYKTADGWEFSNGMKVYFIGEVVPESYAQGLYYVEGVGTSIDLIPINDLEVPAIFTQDTQIPFDTNGFDRVPFSDARSFAGSKDYIVINKKDASRNAWARYNRWFHRSVIQKSAEINNQPMNLDQSARAKRPIIEFEADLRLFNHGNTAKQNVDLVDTFTKDVFSTIEGNIGYNIDGIDVADGMRILFTADPDPLVANKIFEVNFILHNNRTQISLIETTDTDPILDQTVLVKDGNKFAGRMFWFNGTTWNLAQDKTGLNQAPLFDLFDRNGNSIGDNDYYLNNDFAGNRVFAYRVGESVNDAELGFPIVYKNFANIGDIVFDFDLLKKSYNYELANQVTSIESDQLFLKQKTIGSEVLVNGWRKANRLSRQFVVRKFTGEELTNNFPVDVYNNSADLTDLQVKVFVNNDYKLEGIDYSLINENKIRKVILNNEINFDDIVILKTHSSATKNANGYYEIPHNLERNPLNNNITEFTLGQVNDHVEGLVQEIAEFEGLHPGVNNLRDLGIISQFGRKFVQHSGPINLPMYHLISQNANIVKAIKYANNEYGKFKRSFIQSITEDFFDGSIKDHVDFAVKKVNTGKSKISPFYSTDMAGTGGATRITYEVLDNRNPFYALNQVFSLDTISFNAVYVYINGEQLIHGTEYEFDSSGFVKILKTFNNGDVIDLYEYSNTEGSFIPPTPSKMGMYPAYRPEKFTDTSYQTPTNVIRCHDGSLIVAFNDYRDDLILELEKRIYNNIKVEYNPDIFDIHDIIGGNFRNTKVAKEDLDRAMISDFLDWLKIAKLADYTNNDFSSLGSSFTYNYSQSKSPTGNILPGFWRGVYKQAYDTDRPHTHPWEMLGFASQPVWWESVYGPAPYTSSNLILWQDLEQGLVKEPNAPVKRLKKYIRPGLSSHIPVNENGQLLSPLESSYAQDFSYVLTRDKDYKFGDEAPTETAWRRSSSYPYSLMVAAVLLRPAHTLGVGFDRSRIIRDLSGDLVYRDTNKRINLENLIFPKIVNGQSVTISSGFINYISEYVTKSNTSNYSSYINDLTNITNKIGFKLSGFADKEKLKLVLDSKTPLNKGNVFVPFENYDIVLRKSAPQEVVVYSGVIIEKLARGYKISGYDNEQPYFKFNPVIPASNDPNFNVGGISESFIEWSENKILVAGKIIRNGEKYYRVNQNHNTGTSFDLSFYTQLPSLPVVGGANALLRRNFSNKTVTVDYGTVYFTEQEVVDFLFGYQNYLQKQGFDFTYFNANTGAIEDFTLSAKEFLFWTTQNWATSSVLAISPGANRLIFNRDYYVVDDVFNSFYGYPILNENARNLDKTLADVIRDNTNNFGLISLEDGVYLAKLPLVQKEHVVLIDNTTVFNDTIFDPEPGYRQERIKVVGYRTEWNGSLNIPGFLYDQAYVTEWTSWKDYQIGDLVKHKEFYYTARFKHTGKETFDASDWTLLPERPVSSLKPNWDYRANQFTDFYDLDTDNFDSEQQRLAQHLIGYQKREYLANIIQDDVSQYKFYQGMIQDKGTNNALTKMFDKLGSANKDSLEFYEEWAFRLGQYGATTSFEEVEYIMDESKFRIEPQLLELVTTVDNTRTDLVFQYPRKDVYLAPNNYTHRPLPETYTDKEYSKTGGYVKLDQIDYITKTKVDIIALDVSSVPIGSYIWVPQDKQTWDVLKHIQAPIRIISITKTDAGFEARFDRPVTFNDGDIVGFNNINDEVNGFWIARNIKYDTIEVYLDIQISEEFIDLSDSTLGIVTQLNSRRVTNIEDINNITRQFDLDLQDRFWADNNGTGKFETVDIAPVFEFKKNYINPESGDNRYGNSVAVNNNNTVMAIGAPDLNKVYIYSRISESLEYNIIQTLEPNTNLYDNGEFGTSVSITANGQYLFVGAPTASNVLSKYKGTINPAGSYTAGDIVDQRGTLWRALVDVNPDSSTINLESDDWEPVDILEADLDGISSGLTSQGVVHIYKKQNDNSFRETSVIMSPLSDNNEKFGIAIKTASPTELLHNVYIRSLADNGRVYFVENLDSDPDLYKYSRSHLYKGEWNTIYKYIEGEIVYYNGALYQAKSTVDAGNLWNTTAAGLPADYWTQLDNYVDYVGYVPNTGDGDLLDEDSSDFGIATTNSIAHTFDVSSNGEVFVIGALLDTDPSVSNTEIEYRVSVYRKANGRYTFSQNIDSDIDDTLFGSSFAINSSGDTLAISAIADDENGIDNGKVYIYKQNNGQFVFDQALFSPVGEKNEKFGVKLDFSEDKLAVLSVNGDTQFTITLDGGLTTLDNNSTQITDTIKNNGQVYVFEKINNKLVYAEKMAYATDIRTARDPYLYFAKNHYYLVSPGVDTSTTRIGIVADFRSDISAKAITTNSVGQDFVDTSKIKGVFLYDKTNGDLVTYLDYIDPIQGKIAGPAEQEISYKTYYDPAIYNVGSTNTGSTNVWDRSFVGKLWWDLSSVKWYNPYQGNIDYKSNTWNKIIPSFSIDVYEWVESDYLPEEYDLLADTVEGIAEGISGRSKYSNNTYTRTKVYDPITGSFSQKYYFWVKGNRLVPDIDGRRISAQDVENLILDPAGYNYKFIAMLNGKEFALHNVRSLIKDKDIVLHFDYDVLENANSFNIHSEYELLTESLASSKPSNILVDKWIDSLVGYNPQNNQLPDLSVSIARRYGILNSPMQSMFVNKTEALKQIVERVNNVFSKNLIVDEFDISPLQQIDPAPTKFSGEWDTVVESENLLRFVGTAKLSQAKLSPVIEDGVITDVNIIHSGRGYIDPNYTSGKRKGPVVEIVGKGSDAQIQLYINSVGQVIEAEVVSGGKNYLDTTTLIVRPYSVLVKNDSTVSGFWAIYSWNSNSREWFRQTIQNYDVTKYWQYVDYYADGYDATTAIDDIVPGSYALSGLNNAIGDVVKIENIGSGGWLLLEKIDNQENVDYTINYKVIGRQNGTIQLSKLLYNNLTSGFDNQVYDSVLYDREPIDETRIIMYALRDNLFVDQLEVEWNKLFFASVRYALSEQVNVDWVFKSSFVTAKHNVGELTQKITYQNDNLPNYQDYVNEVKPFSTKVREYISAYEKLEPTQTSVTDFDLPPRYDITSKKIVTDPINVINNVISNINSTTVAYPQKHWLDNVGYEITAIVVKDGGRGYSNTANVTISGGGGPTLKGLAYLAGDSISYVDVNTTGAKYLSAPTVTIEDGLDEDGISAKIYVVIGAGVTRTTHMLMKFDRTSGNYLFETLDETQTFVGNGGLEEYTLKWPLSTKTADVSISIDNELQLSSDYTVYNKLDTTLGYDRYLGVVKFTNPPSNNSQIVINYKKSVSMLNVADRIKYFYNPTTGMFGKDLAQLMDGIDYGGTQIDSIDFGENQGFDVSTFGVDFDNLPPASDDEIIVLDGSTQVVSLSNVLESGVAYNIYLNNVRIDDPNYNNSLPPESQTGVVNPNAKMATVTGDNITSEVFLDSDVILTKDGDVVIVRKSTSDGSFTPAANTLDVEYKGGNLAQTTATGIDAGAIIVDGDGFVTETTSKGPEEQVPGQVLDTLDLKVYSKVSNGHGFISARTYITDGITVEYEFDPYPQADTSILVKLDSWVFDQEDIEVDWENKSVRLADSTAFAGGKNLTIISFGNSGANILDSDKIIADGNTQIFETGIKYVEGISAFVTKNGVVQTLNAPALYSLQKDENDFVVIEFPTKPTKGTVINYTLYNGTADSYSQLLQDNTFNADGVNKIHRWENPAVPVPRLAKPLSHRVLISVNERFLNPGYRKVYTLTSTRGYDIDAWQFEDTTRINGSDVFVYIDGIRIENGKDYVYNGVDGRVELLKNNVGIAGQEMEIFILKDAEYFFLNTVLTIENGNEINDRVQGDIVEFRSTDDSSIISATVESFVRDTTNNKITLTLQGYIRELALLRSSDNTPPYILDMQDSTQQAILGDINYVETDSVVLETPPANGAKVQLYTFSNHDIADIQRNTYDIVYTTTRAPRGTQEYVDKNALQRGYIKLQSPTIAANFVWVLRNGVLQTPNQDYKLVDSLDAIQMLGAKLRRNETIEIIQFAAPVVKPKYGFRIFKDILNRTHYKRFNDKNQYELDQPLNWYDTSILLVDGSGLTTPNRTSGIPGVIWIDKERIEYYSVDGNTLRQLRRGTLGTGVPVTHAAGEIVYGQGPEETIPYQDQTLTTTFLADGSTGSFVLDFVAEINDNNTVDVAEIFVAGRRLRKTPLQVFDKTLDQDSPLADITVAPEYSVQNVIDSEGITTSILTLADIPPANVRIQVIRKVGKLWNQINQDGTVKSLSDSKTEPATFITDKTISLPR